jgi:hypothetical protein
MPKKDDPHRWGVEEGGSYFIVGPYDIPSSYKGERVVLDEGTRQQLARMEVMLTEIQEHLGIGNESVDN